MYELNPTLFKFNNKYYSLVRNESIVEKGKWSKSKFGYSLNILDINLNKIIKKRCKFEINQNIFSEIKRCDIKNNFYVIEDIKIIQTDDIIEDKIIGISNILINNKWLMCCGLISIDVNTNTIKFIKKLSIPNMNNCEKNWTIINNRYLIYSLFPELIIYSIDNNYKLSCYLKKNTLDQIYKNSISKENIHKNYKKIFLTCCQNIIKLNEQFYLIYTKKRNTNDFYEYYYCILDLINWNLNILDQKLYSGFKLYLNCVNIIDNRFYLCWGLSDKNYSITKVKIQVNLLYFNKVFSLDDHISLFIIKKLINNNKYDLLINKKDIPINIICGGSYLNFVKDNTFIFGTGISNINTNNLNHDKGKLFVSALRGPLSREYLSNNGISVNNIYGDPILLLPKFYQPTLNNKLKDMIGVIPNKSNYNYYSNYIDSNKYFLINIDDQWENIINSICSCKAIISQSLTGLICSDAYNIPNIYLQDCTLEENNFEFKDYYNSQNRDYIMIRNISEYDISLLYKDGNKIDIDKLLKYFPFS